MNTLPEFSRPQWTGLIGISYGSVLHKPSVAGDWACPLWTEKLKQTARPISSASDAGRSKHEGQPRFTLILANAVFADGRVWALTARKRRGECERLKKFLAAAPVRLIALMILFRQHI